MADKAYVSIPDCDEVIYPGDTIKIGRFDSVNWIVCYGWYSWGGNRPVLGWYLKNSVKECMIKPLQSTDLIDIYVIERG